MRSSYLRTLLFLLPVLLQLSCARAETDYDITSERAYRDRPLQVAFTGTGVQAHIRSLQAPEGELSGDSFPLHLAVALAYEGVTEATGRNDGPQVEAFLRSVGLPAGNPYCAAFVSYVLDETEAELNMSGTPGGHVDPPPQIWPQIRSGLAYDFITDRSIEARKVLRGAAVPDGAIVIWRRGDTIYGHAGFVMAWHGARGSTIEANTSPGSAGPQADGDGVWRRERMINPANYFRITHFTPVYYA